MHQIEDYSQIKRIIYLHIVVIRVNHMSSLMFLQRVLIF